MKNLQTTLEKLLKREMTRKEFLGFSMFAMASAFGIVGILKALESHAATPTASFEPEDGVKNGGTTVSDSTASGGSAVQFGASGGTSNAAGWQEAVDSRDYTTMQNWYVANTGYKAAGYALSDLTPGAIVSQYDGQVFEGISASVVRIAHNNVTVRGCLIQGGGTYGYYNNPTFGSAFTGTVIEYCTFIGGDPAIDKAAILCESDPSAGIAATFRNCELTGWSSGFLGNGGVAAEYCYIHDFYSSSVEGAHVSSMVARGANVRFYRNYATEGGSPICSIYFDQRPVSNVTIQQNILSARMSQSGNSPSYLLFGKAGSYEASSTGIVIGGNYLGDTAGVDFQFGRTAGMGNVQWGSNGNIQTSNYDFLTGEEV